MTKYRIYYRRDPSFREDKTLTKSKVHSNSFIFIADLEDLSKVPVSVALDKIFRRMQAEFIDPMLLFFIKIRKAKYGKLHTSMSVGDCIENSKTGAIYQCADTGWSRVPSKR